MKIKAARGELRWLNVSSLVTLQRNPQYLAPGQMDSLKSSIRRDGFAAPILVRPLGRGRYEIVSGNHRFLAAQELGHAEVPVVIMKMTDSAARRVAVNLNLIHGNPKAELLAPFLAELDDESLSQIHLERDMLEEIERFDKELKLKLDQLAIPETLDNDSPTTSIKRCRCPKCGKDHLEPGAARK